MSLLSKCYRFMSATGSAEITLLINGVNVNGRGLSYSGNTTNMGDLHIPQTVLYRRYLSANDTVVPSIYVQWVQVRTSYLT